MITEIVNQEREVQENTKDIPMLVSEVTSIKIVVQEDYDKAFDYTKKIKAKLKELDELRKSLTKPIDEAKRKIMDMFRGPQEKLFQAEKILKSSMITFQDEQEKIRREAERKLREKAEKEAEKEREKLLNRAKTAESKGKDEKAEELREAAESIQPLNINLAETVSTPQGGSFRMKYTAEVVNFKDLPDDYKMADMKALNSFVQAKKGQVSIPGVVVKSEKIMSVRA